MINKIQAFITSQQLFDKEAKILIGVSGGRDSIVLAKILQTLGYKIALAHCNFKLRDKESDRDEQFVLKFAKENQLDVFNTSFNTNEYAGSKNISIQMAARELRYNWFEELRTSHKYDFVAIAHNSDDIVETFFINLIRGTGIEGLSGIKSKNNKTVRPLLNTSREEINEYIDINKIEYCEDSTNASTKYIRNKIRHHIIPEFRSVSPGFDKTMLDNIEHLNQCNQVYKNEIEFKKSKIFINLSENTKIDIDRLKHLQPIQTYLYEFLKPYGFNATNAKDISLSLDSESGKIFKSKTHQIVKDRGELILSEINIEPTSELFFDETNTEINSPVSLTVKTLSIDDFKLQKSNKIMAFDYDKLSFPLLIKKWEHGDFFMPLGMNRMKKISDFLIDNKISMTEKELTYIIKNKSDIISVIGMRIDDRYKINPDTKKVLLITKS